MMCILSYAYLPSVYATAAAAAAKLLQLCLRLYGTCSLADFFVHGILQARILEWVAVPFSRGSS